MSNHPSFDPNKSRIIIDHTVLDTKPERKRILERATNALLNAIPPTTQFILITFPISMETQLSVSTSVPPGMARQIMNDWAKQGYPFE